MKANIKKKKSIKKQAGAELGQAQLKLELGFTSTSLHQIEIADLAIASCS